MSSSTCHDLRPTAGTRASSFSWKRRNWQHLVPTGDPTVFDEPQLTGRPGHRDQTEAATGTVWVEVGRLIKRLARAELDDVVRRRVAKPAPTSQTLRGVDVAEVTGYHRG